MVHGASDPAVATTSRNQEHVATLEGVKSRIAAGRALLSSCVSSDTAPLQHGSTATPRGATNQASDPTLPRTSVFVAPDGIALQLETVFGPGSLGGHHAVSREGEEEEAGSNSTSTPSTTPDPKKAPSPSLWGAFEGMVLSPVKRTVERVHEKVNRRVEIARQAISSSAYGGGENSDEEELGEGTEGRGRVVLTADGHTFEGSVNDENQMHGYGVLRWPDGHSYQGQFHNGETFGLGRRTWASGHCYVGEERQGLKQGVGIFSWPGGKRYEGEYEEGDRCGFGIMSHPSGRWYAGYWRGGLRHGDGLEWEGGGGRRRGCARLCTWVGSCSARSLLGLARTRQRGP